MAHIANITDAAAEAIIDAADEFAVAAAIIDGSGEQLTAQERESGNAFLKANPLTAMLFGATGTPERELSVA